jgi:hypothetical protein
MTLRSVVFEGVPPTLPTLAAGINNEIRIASRCKQLISSVEPGSDGDLGAAAGRTGGVHS